MMLRDLGAPKSLVQERKKPMEILGADDDEEQLLWADLMGQGLAAEATVSREIRIIEIPTRSRERESALLYRWIDDQPVESWVSTLASVFRSSHSRKAFSVIKRHRPTRTVGRSLC
jgi:hypothetical protein